MKYHFMEQVHGFLWTLSWNVVISSVDNRSSSHIDSRKNSFLVLGEGPNDDVNGVSVVEKEFSSINFSTSRDKFCFSLHYNADSSYLFVNRKKTKIFLTDNKNTNFPNSVLFRKHTWKISSQKKHHLKELFMSLKLIMMLLSIHKILIVNDNTKQRFEILKKYLSDY